MVFRHFPRRREGFLTNTRSKLVSRETLGRLAKEMGVLDLILSNGRNSSHNSYMGGNAFEALVGAIYLDRGFDACMRFMEKKILKEVINIDKVAYKEVNFKSKLIEWGQKNRVKLEFGLISQEKDDNGSPKFAYEVVLEGIKGEKGEGYSKKEAQQMASKLTLQRLRKEPQFIDAIFAAKTERTKMEEEPVSVPEEEEPSKSETPSNSPSLGGESKVGKSSLSREALDGSPKQGEQEEASIDLSLDDITVTPKEQSREDIIAAAEAAAFAEEE
jgi:ribonuclease-3